MFNENEMYWLKINGYTLTSSVNELWSCHATSVCKLRPCDRRRFKLVLEFEFWPGQWCKMEYGFEYCGSENVDAP